MDILIDMQTILRIPNAFIVLRLYTFTNVFVGIMSRFKQYKNHTTRQILHTGPLRFKSG